MTIVTPSNQITRIKPGYKPQTPATIYWIYYYALGAIAVAKLLIELHRQIRRKEI